MQLEEVEKGEESAKREILQYASLLKACNSMEATLDEIKLQMSFIEKSNSNYVYVFLNINGGNQHQLQTSNAQNQGSKLVLQIAFIYHLEQDMTWRLIG